MKTRWWLRLKKILCFPAKQRDENNFCKSVIYIQPTHLCNEAPIYRVNFSSLVFLLFFLAQKECRKWLNLKVEHRVWLFSYCRYVFIFRKRHSFYRKCQACFETKISRRYLLLNRSWYLKKVKLRCHEFYELWQLRGKGKIWMVLSP